MLNVSDRKYSEVLHDTESAEISQKQDGCNYYILYICIYIRKKSF